MLLKKLLLLLASSVFLFANNVNTALPLKIEPKSYNACASTLKQAKIKLSGLISSAVSSENTQIEKSERINGKEKASLQVKHKNRVSSNLKLFNITPYKKGEDICVKVFHQDQVEKTKILLKKLLQISLKNLPNDLDERVKTIQTNLDELQQFEDLSTIFMTQMKDKDQQKLYALKKSLTDEYTKSISKINALIFKVCQKDATKIPLLAALNNKIFIKEKKSIKEEAKSFFSKIKTLLKSDKEDKQKLLLDSVVTLVHYKNENDKRCIFIEKKALLATTKKRFNAIKLYKKEFLKKDPQAALKQIKSWLKELEITKEFMKVFPNNFKSTDFKSLTDTKKRLEKLQENINPQSVTFSIEGAEDTKIKLDKRKVKENTAYNIRAGVHNYKVTATGKCPIQKSFTLDKNEDKTIELDLNDQSYATLFVQSNQPATLIINGDVFPVNKKVTLNNCADDIPYTIKFLDQSFNGKFDLRPNEKIYKEFNFLSDREMAIFQNVKTQNFNVTSKQKFSDALTPFQSKRLIFKIEDKPAHGDIDLNKKGTFVYVSTDNFIGVDTFTYKINTEHDESATKAVHITIQPDKLLIAAQKAKAAEEKRKEDLITKEKIAQENKETLTTEGDLLEKEQNSTTKEAVQEKVAKVKTKAKKLQKNVQEKTSQESDDEGINPAILKAFIIKKVRDGHPELLHKIALKYPKTFKKVINEVKEELRNSDQ